MRVGFDGRDLLRKRTGIVNYAVHLARQDTGRPDCELLVYADNFEDPGVSPPTGVAVRRLPGRAIPGAWKHLSLPLALKRDRVDLFHSPTGTLPFVAPCPEVVTIHDLFALVEPAWFPRGVAAHLVASQRRAARAASAVIAVSETTRNDLVRLLGIPEARIEVIHNGVDAERFNPPPEGTEDLDAIAARFGVRRPFVLCVGSLMPWRNAPALLRAHATMRARWGLPHELVFVGRDIWGTDPTAGITRETGWDAWTRFPGYVPDDDLPALYRAASVVAVPSLYEGFGIPPLEAMAAGTPVVASTAGALPEIVADAAVLVDPRDEDALAEALFRVATDEALRKLLRDRGFERSARMTWRRAADETWGVYEGVLGR